MVKKLTIEFVRDQFRERRSWDLLENVYYNSKQKLKYWCNHGQHEHTTTWSHFNAGKGCGVCAKDSQAKKEASRKPVLSQDVKTELYRNILERSSWSLRDVYVSSHIPLRVECPVGHLTTKRASEINKAELNGLICGVCDPPGKKKLSIDFVRKGCLSHGFEMLSNEYHGASIPFEVRCLIASHKTQKTWGNIQQGRQCTICTRSEKITIEYARDQFFKRKNWELLSDVYESPHEKLRFYCNNGRHEHAISWNAFQNGIGCGVCSGQYSITTEYVRAAFFQEGMALKSEYVRSADLLWFECENEHFHAITWNAFIRGNRCGKCARPDRTPEMIESQKIANRLVSGLVKALNKVGNQKFNGSRTSFCRLLAEQVFAKLGSRPDSVTINGIEIKSHLDHCVPKSWFDHNSIEQINLAWSRDNFQWLADCKNITKNNRLTKQMMLELTPYQIAIANLAVFRPKQQEGLMKKLGLWMTTKEAEQELKKHQKTESLAVQMELPIAWAIVS